MTLTELDSGVFCGIVVRIEISSRNASTPSRQLCRRPHAYTPLLLPYLGGDLQVSVTTKADNSTELKGCSIGHYTTPTLLPQFQEPVNVATLIHIGILRLCHATGLELAARLTHRYSSSGIPGCEHVNRAITRTSSKLYIPPALIGTA